MLLHVDNYEKMNNCVEKLLEYFCVANNIEIPEAWDSMWDDIRKDIEDIIMKELDMKRVMNFDDIFNS